MKIEVKDHDHALADLSREYREVSSESELRRTLHAAIQEIEANRAYITTLHLRMNMIERQLLGDTQVRIH